MRLIFNAEEEIRCVFHTVVVKSDSLKHKYSGGVRTFVEKHNGRRNKKLTVICGMVTEDLDDAITEIENSGLIEREDFAYFDASCNAIGFELLKRHGGEPSKEVEFSIGWIKGYIQNGGTIIRYEEELL